MVRIISIAWAAVMNLILLDSDNIGTLRWEDKEHEEKSDIHHFPDHDRSMSLRAPQSDQGIAWTGRNAESTVMALLGQP